MRIHYIYSFVFIAADFESRKRFLDNLGLTSEDFIQYCTPQDLQDLSSTFKKIPRRAFDHACTLFENAAIRSQVGNDSEVSK